MTQPIRTVHISSDFKKSFHKLPRHIQELAVKKDLAFRQNAFTRLFYAPTNSKALWKVIWPTPLIMSIEYYSGLLTLMKYFTMTSARMRFMDKFLCWY